MCLRLDLQFAICVCFAIGNAFLAVFSAQAALPANRQRCQSNSWCATRAVASEIVLFYIKKTRLAMERVFEKSNRVDFKSMSGIEGNDNRFFVGKVEQYFEHWKVLTSVCEDVLPITDELQLMPSYGARSYLNASYLQMMDLVGWEKGDVLPAYKALDNETFAKIVRGISAG